MEQDQQKGKKLGTKAVSKKAKTYVQQQKPASKVEEGAVNMILGTSFLGSNFLPNSVISGKTDKAEWQMTAVEKMDMVRDGLSKRDLESLKSKTNLDYDKLSTLLATTRATLINKKGTAHFSTALSERILSIADIYSYGYEVFEDEKKFNEWVFRPNRALGGKQPFELLDNQFGREEIKNLIGRIDYGVYS